MDLPRRLGLIRESEAKKRESRLPIAIEMNWARGGTPTDTLLGFINNNGSVPRLLFLSPPSSKQWLTG